MPRAGSPERARHEARDALECGMAGTCMVWVADADAMEDASDEQRHEARTCFQRRDPRHVELLIRARAVPRESGRPAPRPRGAAGAGDKSSRLQRGVRLSRRGRAQKLRLIGPRRSLRKKGAQRMPYGEPEPAALRGAGGGERLLRWPRRMASSTSGASGSRMARRCCRRSASSVPASFQPQRGRTTTASAS